MQFYLGMEETPYTGGTHTTFENTGHRLSLPVVQHELGSFTGLTNISGTRDTTHAIEFARLKIAGACEEEWDTALSSGNFDVRIDFDLVTTQSDTSGTGEAMLLVVYFDANNMVRIRLTNTNTLEFRRTTGGVGATVGSATAANAARFGTLRITRTTNDFAAYYWSYATNAWVQIGSTYTNAYAGSPKVRIAQAVAGGSAKWYASNIRSVFPSSTSGNWESADLDTVDGYRGLSWYEVAGTGTVTVEVKTASTQGGLSGASYSAATNGAAVTPSASNRWVKVKVSVSAGSTTAASPEIGPVFVDSTLEEDNATLLFNTLMCGWVRHTDANYRMALGSAAVTSGSASTALWSRIGKGLGAWIVQNAGSSWTWRNTTFDLATEFVAGYNQTVTDLVAENNMQVEGAQALPGIYEARAYLTISNAQKTAWTDATHGKIGILSATNWNAFALINRQCLNLLNAYDVNWETTGNNLPYATADFDTNWTNLNTSYNGDGIWDDSSGSSEHYDAYSSSIAGSLSLFAELYPTYAQVSNGTIEGQVKQHRRNILHATDDRGDGIYTGRSVHAASMTGATMNQISNYTGDLYGQVREALGRALMRHLRETHYYGFEFCPIFPTRIANTTSGESGVNIPTVNGVLLSQIGVIVSTPELWAASSQSYAGQSAQVHIWPDAGKAYVRGSDTNDPLITLHGKDWDINATDNYSSKYAGRIVSPRFGQEVNTSSNRPNPQNGFWYFRDSALSANNFCSLQDYTSAFIFRLGKSVALWRTGLAKEFSATVTGTNTTTTMTDVFLAKDNHALAISKIELGARTASLVDINSPVVPLASGESAANAATGSAPLYAYQENADGLAEQITEIEGAADTAATNVTFGAASNRLKNTGQSVRLQDATLTGTQYVAADIALSHAAMVAATEKAYISSYSRATDAVTFQAGTDEDCYLHMGAGGTDPTVGSYTLTGTGVKAFSGKTGATPTYFGGGNLTAISHTVGNLALLQSAGNVAVEIVSATRTKAFTTVGDLTLYPACLPSGFSTVYAYDVDGSRVDVTGSCTITAGVSVVIPSAVVTTYKFGMAEFDVEVLSHGSANLSGGITENLNGGIYQ